MKQVRVNDVGIEFGNASPKRLEGWEHSAQLRETESLNHDLGMSGNAKSVARQINDPGFVPMFDQAIGNPGDDGFGSTHSQASDDEQDAHLVHLATQRAQ